MSELLIFGGTTEGRRLAEFCAESGIPAEISVTTEYGAGLLPVSPFIRIMIGKLSADEMEALFREKKYAAVIDATHPYAEEATRNIRSACKKCGTEYFRLARERTPVMFGEMAESMDELVGRLNKTDSIVLSTLGSKELSKLTEVRDYRRRIWLRVLPSEEIRELCDSLGFCADHLFLEKGPFSEEQNIRHIQLSGAQLLLTKNSGQTGGYSEKIEAAKHCGIDMLTLKRPEESGISFEEAKSLIIELERK